VLESIQADELMIAACKPLKEAGYMIALDDFVVNDSREPLTEVADIIWLIGSARRPRNVPIIPSSLAPVTIVQIKVTLHLPFLMAGRYH
jgi:c-di-GMP-related signal transduction protein